MSRGTPASDIALGTVPLVTAVVEPNAARAIETARSMADARAQRGRDLRLDRLSAIVLGCGFAVTAVCLAALHGPVSGDVATRLVLVAIAYAAASRVVFESVGGVAIAAQPVLVAGLFVLPLPLVPLAVLVGTTFAWISDHPNWSLRDFSAEVLAGWHTLGPVAVLAASGTGNDVPAWPWLVLALIAQFLIDAIVAVTRCAALGIPASSLSYPLIWSYALDALLAPVGLAAAMTTDHVVLVLLFACTPVGLLALLARDRAEHLEHAVTSSAAYEHAIGQATTDVLTELANRRAWTEAVAHAAIEHAADPVGHPVAVLIADVDGLKTVNDTLGHDAGDSLIRACADLLRAAAPPGALVARLGGDEFGILVVAGSITVTELAADVRRRAVAHPGVRGTTVSLSIGVAACPPLRAVEEAVALADHESTLDKATRRAQRV
jgi:diguanylate cyclase (GGDEF)-like protein